MRYVKKAGVDISVNAMILKLCALDVFVLAWAWSYGSFQNISILIPKGWVPALALPSMPAWRAQLAIAAPALLTSGAGVVAILLLAQNLRRKKHNLIDNMRRFSDASEQARAIEARTATTSDSPHSHPFARGTGAERLRTSVWPEGSVSGIGK